MSMKPLEKTVVNLTTQEEYDKCMELFESFGWMWCEGSKPTEFSQKKTFKTLEVGDFVKDEDYGFKKVLAILYRGNETEESVYVMSDSGQKNSNAMKESGGTYTSFTLDKYNFTIDQPEETEELTMEQVCKELGRTIKIKK